MGHRQLLQRSRWGFPLNYWIDTIQISIATVHFCQCFFQQNYPYLASFSVWLAKYRQSIFLNRNIVINNNFFHYSIYSQVYFINSLWIFRLPSKDFFNDFWELSKSSKCREKITVTCMASNHIARLNLLIKNDRTHISKQLWNSSPSNVSRDVSKAVVIGRKGFISELRFLFGKCIPDGLQALLSLHFGDADAFIMLINLFKGVDVTIFLMLALLVLDNTANLVFKFRLFVAAATRHSMIISDNGIKVNCCQQHTNTTSQHIFYFQTLIFNYCEQIIMNRLLSLELHLTKSETFQSYRRSSTINKDEFSRIIYGTNYRERNRAFDIIKKNPEHFQHYHLTQADRSHQREGTTKQVLRVKSLIDLEKYSRTNPNKLTLVGNGFTFYDLNFSTKIGVHYSLYLKTIQRLGTEKHTTFYDNACKYKDFGCFALTELMHGSNVKGLLTEAHYDHQSREIVIHSPSRDAMKFWIGGSAKTSNMCVVWAQLYIKQKCYGVHAFIVPLRCPKTHNTLPGIIIGDCGPKFGLNAVDNGFIMFHKFRIPVGNLLDKVSGVNQKGEFFSVVPGENKRFGMTLAALSEGRLFMCCHSTALGISALTIALRYVYVRRQFANKKGQRQTLLIDYPLTKRRMIPLLAQETIYMCVTMKTFEQSQENEDKNMLSASNPLLQQIHAVSSVLKAKTAWAATEAIRESRQMMGGHGFSAYSKMGALYSNNDVNNTWEGENNVLTQQTTKYVMENYRAAMMGKPIKSPLLQFFANPTGQPLQMNRQSLLNLQKIQGHLQNKIIKKAQQLGSNMMVLKEKNLLPGEIWNSSQVFLGQTLSTDTGDLYILNSCLERLASIKHPDTKRVFNDILHLWALTVIRSDQTISEEYHGFIQKLISELSQKLTPEILGVLQAVSADESIIGSPFADENGDGFQKYMKFVLSQPRKDRAQYWKVVVQR